METVAIVGVGLIGASFGLALKRAGFHGSIIGVSSPGAIRDALARGAIDESLPLEEAAARADLVFLAQPIRRIIETLERLDASLKPGALVTDAGSTKAQIVATGRRAIRRGQFLGGHPMAGKETRGAAEAEVDLFVGRTWVLTPVSASELQTAAAREFVKWLEKIGAVTATLGPEEHDRVVARTSHLPQMMSTALALALAEELNSPEQLNAAGPGLADMVRLAGSSWDIWADIVATNGPEIRVAIDAYIARLESLKATLGCEATAEAFRAANEFAERVKRGKK